MSRSRLNRKKNKKLGTHMKCTNNVSIKRHHIRKLLEASPVFLCSGRHAVSNEKEGAMYISERLGEPPSAVCFVSSREFARILQGCCTTTNPTDVPEGLCLV